MILFCSLFTWSHLKSPDEGKLQTALYTRVQSAQEAKARTVTGNL